jgi:hypothetical protein
LFGGEGLGQAAVFKGLAAAANAGADADLASGPGGGASEKFAAEGRQPGQERQAQTIAQKLAAAVIPAWRR